MPYTDADLVKFPSDIQYILRNRRQIMALHSSGKETWAFTEECDDCGEWFKECMFSQKQLDNIGGQQCRWCEFDTLEPGEFEDPNYKFSVGLHIYCNLYSTTRCGTHTTISPAPAGEDPPIPPGIRGLTSIFQDMALKRRAMRRFARYEWIHERQRAMRLAEQEERQKKWEAERPAAVVPSTALPRSSIPVRPAIKRPKTAGKKPVVSSKSPRKKAASSALRSEVKRVVEVEVPVVLLGKRKRVASAKLLQIELDAEVERAVKRQRVEKKEVKGKK